jgi:CRISPR-associated protein Csd1
MSWIQRLYETYDNQPQSAIGRFEEGVSVPLLPICHTTNKAQIEIAISGEGAFLGASVINEVTIIPCTEESAGRTSGPAPHPLCDKLQYIARDYAAYCDDKGSRFDDYLRILGAWAASNRPHPKVVAVYTYVNRGQVIVDLIKAKVLYLDQAGKLLSKWDKQEPAPAIFKVSGTAIVPSDSFVRWKVELPGSLDSTTWADDSLWESWIEFYTSTKKVKGLCFVMGREALIAAQHPAKIRNAGDKAKLISSNDGSGFTYRGRFTEADQVAGVSFEVTQKAHSALRWLIARQGYRDGDLAIVAWASSSRTVDAPDPLVDTFDFMRRSQGETGDATFEAPNSGQDLALRLRAKTAGYLAKLVATDSFMVLGLDSATPGRMSIIFHRELTGSEYLSRIERWHETCAWPQNLGKDKRFVGAPSPRDIAETCYGRRLDEKLRKATIARLLPCIIDGHPLPLDIVESAVMHATNRSGLDAWEWEKALGIACALFRKCHEDRRYNMGLETDRRTRDYLYGRLLAVADVLEGRALYRAGESRPTTAARLMQRFSDHPCSTWKTIELSLGPYKARLGGSADWFNKLIDDIKMLFDINDFINDRSLGGEFLLGYHCQRAELLKSKKDNEAMGEPSDEDSGNAN